MNRKKEFSDLSKLKFEGLIHKKAICAKRISMIKHVKSGYIGGLAIAVAQMAKLIFTNDVSVEFLQLFIFALYAALSVLALAHSESCYQARKEMIVDYLTRMLNKS